MEGLVDDYQSALTSINKRPTSIVSARAKLTSTAVPSFSDTGKTTTSTKPSVVAGAKPEVKPDALIKTPLPNTGSDTKPTGMTYLIISLS
jgi:hypothetical protein